MRADWLKDELILMMDRESMVRHASDLVDDFRLAGGGTGSETLKPSQINALVREASRGFNSIIEFIERQRRRKKVAKGWNARNGSGDIFSEALKRRIECIARDSGEDKKDVAVAAFMRMLRAVYEIRRSGDDSDIGKDP